MIYKIIRNNLKIPVFAIIMGMLTGNIAFAIDGTANIGKQEMLSPVVRIDIGLFQQGYTQIIDIANQNSNPLNPAQAVDKIIRESASLNSNTFILKFLKIFKEAFDLYMKDDISLNSLNKSAKLLNEINIDDLKRLVPAKNIEIVYLVFTLKAEVLYQLAETDQSLDDSERLKKYSLVRAYLLEAFSLQDIYPDLQNFLAMGTTCAKLATDAKLSLDEKMDLSLESLEYLDKAQEESAALILPEDSRQMIDELNYTHFTVLYFAGDVAKEQKDYKQAMVFYNKAALSLDELLITQPDAIPGLKGFYFDYYLLMRACADNLYEKAENDFKDRKIEIVTLYTRTRELAGKFIKLLSREQKAKAVEFAPLTCIAEVSATLAEESMKDHDLKKAAEHLGFTMQALKDMHKLSLVDQRSNYIIAKINILFIMRTFEFVKAFVLKNGVSDKSMAILVGMLDKDFFAGFLAELKSGTYKDELEKLKNEEDADNEELLIRSIFIGSTSNDKIIYHLKKVMTGRKLKKRKGTDFDSSGEYLTHITIALAYLHKGDYASAEKSIVKAAASSEQFFKNVALVEMILPQAALDGQEGKDFIVNLFRSRASVRIGNNIIKHIESLTPKAKAMLEDIFTARDNNKRLLKGNENLRVALGLEPVKPKAVKGAKTNSNRRSDSGVIKTPDVLIADVNNALVALEKVDEKPKRSKKKGKKKLVKKKTFDSKLRHLRNVLSLMTQAYERRDSLSILEYLKNIVQNNKQVFLDEMAMGVLVQIVADMEKEEAVDILEGYKRIHLENKPYQNQVARGHDLIVRYFQDLREFEAKAKDLVQRISQVDIKKIVFSKSQHQLKKIEKEVENLLEQFKSIKNRPIGKKLHERYEKEIFELLGEAGTDAQAVFEERKSEFLNEFKAQERKLEMEWRELIEKEQTAVKEIVSLKIWQKTQVFSQADDEIRSLPEVQEALTMLSLFWNKKNQDINDRVEKLSLIYEGRVGFEIADDLSTLSFESSSNITRKEKTAVSTEIFQVIKEVLLLNPHMDIEGITMSSINKNFLLSGNQAKQRAENVKKLIQIAYDYDIFMTKYEKAMKEILDKDITKLQRIKQVGDLLGGDFEIGPKVEDIEDSNEIISQALDDFAKRSSAIYAQQDKVETIGNGQIRLQIEGEYKQFSFTPLVEKINISKVQLEIIALWQEILRHNLDIQMVVGRGVDDESEWVSDIADIWHQEYERALKEQEKVKLLNQVIEVDSEKLTKNSDAIEQSI